MQNRHSDVCQLAELLLVTADSDGGRQNVADVGKLFFKRTTLFFHWKSDICFQARLSTNLHITQSLRVQGGICPTNYHKTKGQCSHQNARSQSVMLCTFLQRVLLDKIEVFAISMIADINF